MKTALTAENIICFAKDWGEVPTSNNHVMRELARSNRVLWLNSISTRTPNLASGRDLGKIVRKLAAFLRGPKKVQENLWVYTPLVLPLPYSRWAAALNRRLLRATIGTLRRRLGMRDFQLWTFLPNIGEYVGTLGESVSVYYCTDEWTLFSYIDSARIEAVERQQCERVDIVFATSNPLVQKKSRYNPETHLASHGVHHALFASALEAATPIPADLAALPQPVLGFCGTIQDWVDLDLLVYLAERHPEWTIALVGEEFVDTSCLKPYPNIHLLGRKPHADLPNYYKGFAVGLIPHRLNEWVRYANPLKLREYLSAGLPVVSTAIPAVACYEEFCAAACDYAEFEQGVEQALKTDAPEKRKQRSEATRAEAWDQKVARVGEQVMRVKQQKARRR